jgi:aminoglycoside phosphotransferase (APT) family kinase protein
VPSWSRLTAGSVAAYLLEKDLVAPGQIVDDGLTIVEVSRRNRNFRATNAGGVSYLLKQGVGAERALTVANEASAYEFLQARLGDESAHPFLPRRHLYDAENNVLVLEFLQDSENLREYHTRIQRFPTAVAKHLGQAVAAVHGQASDWENDPDSHPPWAFSALQLPNVGFLREVSGSNIQLVKIIQEFPEYCELLDRLKAGWSRSCLIHGDLKWENCVVFSQAPRGKKLKLVDWELASVGDPGWDVGSIFADYLSYWVFSMPVSGDADPGDFVKLAQWPVKKMQPAMNAFWQAYARELRLNKAERQDRLMRSVSYAGGRLVQTAFEHLQSSNYLTGPAVCLLQLSFNMMKRAPEAAVQLLGIPSEDPWDATWKP